MVSSVLDLISFGQSNNVGSYNKDFSDRRVKKKQTEMKDLRISNEIGKLGVEIKNRMEYIAVQKNKELYFVGLGIDSRVIRRFCQKGVGKDYQEEDNNVAPSGRVSEDPPQTTTIVGQAEVPKIGVEAARVLAKGSGQVQANRLMTSMMVIGQSNEGIPVMEEMRRDVSRMEGELSHRIPANTRECYNTIQDI
ncbi:hypothetical protein NE237_016594 [Protea cynaroides]|uniref:Uncharacterized protein n=1 Tax=Protea cynaroides TaxID=273540 RepID=A0A9Q0K6V6_9MAGN|nr:hypothetical protein NE237_016594 [Protea cynaroides]